MLYYEFIIIIKVMLGPHKIAKFLSQLASWLVVNGEHTSTTHNLPHGELWQKLCKFIWP